MTKDKSTHAASTNHSNPCSTTNFVSSTDALKFFSIVYVPPILMHKRVTLRFSTLVAASGEASHVEFNWAVRSHKLFSRRLRVIASLNVGVLW